MQINFIEILKTIVSNILMKPVILAAIIPLGFGTAFLAGFYGNLFAWYQNRSVGSATSRGEARLIQANWIIKDNTTHRDLTLVSTLSFKTPSGEEVVRTFESPIVSENGTNILTPMMELGKRYGFPELLEFSFPPDQERWFAESRQASLLDYPYESIAYEKMFQRNTNVAVRFNPKKTSEFYPETFLEDLGKYKQNVKTLVFLFIFGAVFVFIGCMIMNSVNYDHVTTFRMSLTFVFLLGALTPVVGKYYDNFVNFFLRGFPIAKEVFRSVNPDLITGRHLDNEDVASMGLTTYTRRKSAYGAFTDNFNLVSASQKKYSDLHEARKALITNMAIQMETWDVAKVETFFDDMWKTAQRPAIESIYYEDSVKVLLNREDLQHPAMKRIIALGSIRLLGKMLPEVEKIIYPK